MKRLGVNIDHIATIRNARGEKHPDPLFASKFVTIIASRGSNTGSSSPQEIIKSDNIIIYKYFIFLSI